MRTMVLGLALLLAGCGSKFSGSEGGATGGTGGVTPGAMGAAEIRLSPPAQSVPNIGTRTNCTAGSTGTYTYFLGATPDGVSPEERVSGAMLRSGSGHELACQVKAMGDDFFVSIELSGVDANSRHVAAGLRFTGYVPRSGTAGLTDVLGFESEDTRELWTSSDIAQCAIGPVASISAGELVAHVSCPAVVSFDNEITGCQLTGMIAVSGCSH